MKQITVNISGPAKSGKSLIAMAIAEALEKAGIDVVPEKPDIAMGQLQFRKGRLPRIIKEVMVGKVKVRIFTLVEKKKGPK